MLLVGGCGVEKPHLIKCFFNCLSKILVCIGKQLEKSRVIKVASATLQPICKEELFIQD